MSKHLKYNKFNVKTVVLERNRVCCDLFAVNGINDEYNVMNVMTKPVRLRRSFIINNIWNKCHII